MLAHYHISFIWVPQIRCGFSGLCSKHLYSLSHIASPLISPLPYFLTYVLTEPRTCIFTRIRCMSSFYFGSGDQIQDLMLCSTITVEPSPSPTLPHFSVCLKTFRIAHQPQIQPRNTHTRTQRAKSPTTLNSRTYQFHSQEMHGAGCFIYITQTSLDLSV